jgi:CRISPR/Cas system CSM-associated protein Csm3 (group 7 of RAMP superfamily)
MRFNVRLKTVGLFCIGWAHPTALGLDIPFIRGTREGGTLSIYIPGSSFKGALRSAASRLAEAYGFKSCGEVRPERIKDVHESVGVCDVCKLFGYPQSRSHSPLIISDLEAVNDVRTLTMTRVRINDESLKSAEGALFTIEYVPPGTEFIGNVTVLDAEQRSLALLLLALAELRLGRFGRSGVVDVKIENGSRLEETLHDTQWLNLLNELRRWLWDGVL